MDKLWAPWRMEYIRRAPKETCPFCRIKKQKERDTENLVLFRLKHSFAVLNKYPYNNGHTLLVSNRHTNDLKFLNDTELLDITKGLIKAQELIQKTINPDGFNLGINSGKYAGAGIAGHLHIHIVPRWKGDTNFMPVIGKTKVISQGLKDLHKILTGRPKKSSKKVLR